MNKETRIVITPEGHSRDVVVNLNEISYAIGVSLRAGALTEGDGCWANKIAAIKYLRMERGFGLYDAKTLIEFAVKMLEQCEGNKLPAMLNPIE